LIINHNISALQLTNRLNKNLSKTEKAMERLSSGLRITRAADLAISKASGTVLCFISRNRPYGLGLLVTITLFFLAFL
jgi:flagellin